MWLQLSSSNKYHKSIALFCRLNWFNCFAWKTVFVKFELLFTQNPLESDMHVRSIAQYWALTKKNKTTDNKKRKHCINGSMWFTWAYIRIRPSSDYILVHVKSVIILQHKCSFFSPLQFWSNWSRAERLTRLCKSFTSFSEWRTESSTGVITVLSPVSSLLSG